ncbi:hypothetical protein AVEN_261881-1 [Araneus ventricosus]|uniref:Uncharacterized protein n=1 Tax=Araneus ventricosus TaxID=182803 RepID=A0A4Y2T7L2_ARAVE|nr:hypothetical protein AVEN_261881-1 [Araneus ventricosus]
MSSTKCCKKSVNRLGWNVLEAINDETKVLERKVWLGGKDKNVLVRNLTLPNANTFAEERKCGARPLNSGLSTHEPETLPLDQPESSIIYLDLWKSNQFTFTTDDAGIGILCLKQFLSIGVHSQRNFSKGTGETGDALSNENDFWDNSVENQGNHASATFIPHSSLLTTSPAIVKTNRGKRTDDAIKETLPEIPELHDG